MENEMIDMQVYEVQEETRQMSSIRKKVRNTKVEASHKNHKKGTRKAMDRRIYS
jgi:hypothetical protein